MKSLLTEPKTDLDRKIRRGPKLALFLLPVLIRIGIRHRTIRKGSFTEIVRYFSFLLIPLSLLTPESSMKTSGMS